MANHFDVAKADRETIRQNGYCQMYAERGFNIIGAYPTAFAAYQAVPQKRGGTPPNDGNYYLIYFDGWYNLGEGMQRYGDIAVYRNGQVWSGSSLSFRVNPVSFDYYKSWIGTTYLCWSEYLGNRKIATIGGAPVATIGKESNWRWRFNRLHRQLVRNADVGDATFNSIVGKDAWKVVEDWSSHPESDLLIADQVLGERARKENWAKQIADLGKRPTQAQLDALQKQAKEAVDASNVAKQESADFRKENERLQGIQTSDAQAGEALSRRIGQWIKKYLP
jgi:hypothetical protein